MADGFTLITGLNDLSGELGESTVNSTTKRITAYGHAVVTFAKAKKWPFLVKSNSTLLTTAGVQTYALPAAMDDRRKPNGIKAIYIGTATEPLSGNDYYFDEDESNLIFTRSINVTGQAIKIYYYYIPARLTDISDTTTLYPIPDSMRKIISTLAAAYVQWSRYLDAQGNRLYNLYQKLLVETIAQQNETNTGGPRKVEHFLKRIGFKRIYR